MGRGMLTNRPSPEDTCCANTKVNLDRTRTAGPSGPPFLF